MRVLLPVVCLGSLLLVGFTPFNGAVAPPADLKKGFDAISARDAKAVLSFLAGPACNGRGTGTEGFQKAADFVAARFKAAGLKPMGDSGTYFQCDTFYRYSVKDPIFRDAAGHPLAKGGVTIGNPSAKDIDLNAPIVVVKAKDASSKISDADEAKLDGKIILLQVPAGRSTARTQAMLADAVMVLSITDESLIQDKTIKRRKTATAARPTGKISSRLASRLSKSISDFLKDTSTPGATFLEAKDPTHFSAQAVEEAVKVPNVVGLLEGSDPKLKEQVIGVGGHLDHLGVQDGKVYPGADDDGSGSTAVLEIVRGVAANKVKPKRSILFMTFFGEEMGLLGSEFLSEHPPFPFDKWVAELQMDMVARDSYGAQNGDLKRIDKVEENLDTIRLVGSKRISSELDPIIQNANKYVGFRFLYDSEDVYTRSDHYNFAKHGVPISFLFDGFTPDYHQPTDTVDKIDWLKLTNAARLYYLTAMDLANREEPIKRDVEQK